MTVSAPHLAAWHLLLSFSLRRCGLPAAARIFWLFCAPLRGELPGTGASSAIPIANHQSFSQSHLACLMGTGWVFYLQRPGRLTQKHLHGKDWIYLLYV